ncbi:ABC transporter permease [Shigella sonnei]
MTFSEGKTFNQEQLNGRAEVVVLDRNTAASFSPTSRCGRRGDSVGNMPARVIGVAEEKQSMFGSSKCCVSGYLTARCPASHGRVVA